MAYNNRNHIHRRERAMEMTRLYYEQGRQDRCYRWVWRKYIKDAFNIEYGTYLLWIRAERKRTGQSICRQLDLFGD